MQRKSPCTFLQANGPVSASSLLALKASSFIALVVAGLAFTLLGSKANADEFEWDPSYGYHEEEWYDPSDWFDANTGVDYESDYFGDYYDDEYYDDEPYSSYYGGTDYYDEGPYDEGFYDEYYDNEVYDDEYGLDYYEPGDGDYGYDSWYGDGYYTNDWFDPEPDFDNFYDGAYD